MLLNIGLILAQILGTAVAVGVGGFLFFDNKVSEKRKPKPKHKNVKDVKVNIVWEYNHLNGCWEVWTKD
tara:strand:- start:29038 stop:29244 length:207 start_codon:yes stop_codon:yes gene_type:complete